MRLTKKVIAYKRIIKEEEEKPKVSIKISWKYNMKGRSKLQTSASCGHLRTVVQTIQISGL